MKSTNYFFLLLSFFAFGQESLSSEHIGKTSFKADTLIGIDAFKTLFFTKNNTLIAKKEKETLKYSNIQLGPISSANTFNPLKISVFYKAFNTVVILDNRLAEIYRIDFNAINSYRNVTHISTGSDNTFWLYNQDNQVLELFDYKTNKTRAKTLPIKSDVLDITSNYNTCWLLTKDYLYAYSYFGSLLFKIQNIGFTKLKESDDNLILKRENKLYYLDKDTKTFSLISIPNLLINQFLVLNEIVYIYHGGFLHQYQIKKK